MPTHNPSRRDFLELAGLSVFGLTFPSPFSIRQSNAMMMYVGTYTENTDSQGIYAYRLDAATGKLTLAGTTTGVKNPSYLALDSQNRYLYAVNELAEFNGKPGGGVSAFAVDRSTGKLTLLNQQSSLGAAPCYVTVDQTGKFVLVANYTGGNAAIFPVQASGQLAAASDRAQHQGSSVNPNRQKEPHAHCIVLDAKNRYAFVADLGIDKIMRYRVDWKQGKLIALPPVPTKPGAGPRHFAFHPTGNYAFAINELNSTITAYAYDQTTGGLTEQQTVPALPPDFTGNSTCADIHVSPNGLFLYGSNRGHDSIVTYAIDPKTGNLTYVQHTLTQGKTPRNFTLDPSGTFLFAANQQSNTIVTFRIDEPTGKLTPTGQVTEVPAPVCLRIVG